VQPDVMDDGRLPRGPPPHPPALPRPDLRPELSGCVAAAPTAAWQRPGPEGGGSASGTRQLGDNASSRLHALLPRAGAGGATALGAQQRWPAGCEAHALAM